MGYCANVPTSSVEGCNRCICRSYPPAFAWHGRNLATSQSQMVSHDAVTMVTSTMMQWMPTKGKLSTARSSKTTTKKMPTRLYQRSSRAHQLVCISRITWCLVCLLSFPVLKRMRSFAQKLSHDIRPILASKRGRPEAESKRRQRELCWRAAIWRKRAAKCPTTVAKIGLQDVSCGQKICRICRRARDLT